MDRRTFDMEDHMGVSKNFIKLFLKFALIWKFKTRPSEYRNFDSIWSSRLLKYQQNGQLDFTTITCLTRKGDIYDEEVRNGLISSPFSTSSRYGCQLWENVKRFTLLNAGVWHSLCTCDVIHLCGKLITLLGSDWAAHVTGETMRDGERVEQTRRLNSFN